MTQILKSRTQMIDKPIAAVSTSGSELVERLEEAAGPVRMNNGSFSDIAHEAASTITTLSTRNAELERQIDRLAAYIMENVPGEPSESARLKARLAEALKALNRLLVPFEGGECRKDHHGYCQTHFLEEDCCVAAARRVREGGKVDG